MITQRFNRQKREEKRKGGLLSKEASELIEEIIQDPGLSNWENVESQTAIGTSDDERKMALSEFESDWDSRDSSHGEFESQVVAHGRSKRQKLTAEECVRTDNLPPVSDEDEQSSLTHHQPQNRYSSYAKDDSEDDTADLQLSPSSAPAAVVKKTRTNAVKAGRSAPQLKKAGKPAAQTSTRHSKRTHKPPAQQESPKSKEFAQDEAHKTIASWKLMNAFNAINKPASKRKALKPKQSSPAATYVCKNAHCEYLKGHKFKKGNYFSHKAKCDIRENEIMSQDPILSAANDSEDVAENRQPVQSSPAKNSTKSKSEKSQVRRTGPVKIDAESLKSSIQQIINQSLSDYVGQLKTECVSMVGQVKEELEPPNKKAARFDQELNAATYKQFIVKSWSLLSDDQLKHLLKLYPELADKVKFIQSYEQEQKSKEEEGYDDNDAKLFKRLLGGPSASSKPKARHLKQGQVTLYSIMKKVVKNYGYVASVENCAAAFEALTENEKHNLQQMVTANNHKIKVCYFSFM